MGSNKKMPTSPGGWSGLSCVIQLGHKGNAVASTLSIVIPMAKVASFGLLLLNTIGETVHGKTELIQRRLCFYMHTPSEKHRHREAIRRERIEACYSCLSCGSKGKLDYRLVFRFDCRDSLTMQCANSRFDSNIQQR